MNKGITLRGCFILLSGIAFSLLSGLINFSNYSVIELLGSGLYFFFIAFIISSGCVWIVSQVRESEKFKNNPAEKIIAYSSLSAIMSALLTVTLLFGWLRISKEAFNWNVIVKSSCINVLFAIIYSLSYEIMQLSRERVLDTK